MTEVSVMHHRIASALNAARISSALTVAQQGDALGECVIAWEQRVSNNRYRSLHVLRCEGANEEETARLNAAIASALSTNGVYAAWSGESTDPFYVNDFAPLLPIGIDDCETPLSKVRRLFRLVGKTFEDLATEKVDCMSDIYDDAMARGMIWQEVVCGNLDEQFGYCYYLQDDADCVSERGWLTLWYGTLEGDFEAPPKAEVDFDDVVAAAFERNGLAVEWGDTLFKSIRVSLLSESETS